MKDHTYWTFNRRHPLEPGDSSLKNRALRFFDRIDDAWMACLASIEFNRIQRVH